MLADHNLATEFAFPIPAQPATKVDYIYQAIAVLIAGKINPIVEFDESELVVNVTPYDKSRISRRQGLSALPLFCQVALARIQLEIERVRQAQVTAEQPPRLAQPQSGMPCGSRRKA